MLRFSFILFAVSLVFAATPQMIKRDMSRKIQFSNPDIKTSYSPLMLEKNSRADSLLPALNGDMALADLLAANPNLWSIENLRNEKNLTTKLNVNIIYIDGIREEAYCDFSKTTSAENWELTIGIDFVSGSSNTAAAHVYLCMEMVRDSIGYATQDSSGKTLVIPPKKILEEIAKSQIPDAIPIDLQMELLKAHKSVEEDGQCPSDIKAYLILFDVWKQVRHIEMDLPVISEALYRETVRSCAFSREWNKNTAKQPPSIAIQTIYANITKAKTAKRSGFGTPLKIVWNSKEKNPFFPIRQKEHPRWRHNARFANNAALFKDIFGKLHEFKRRTDKFGINYYRR